jgi:rSAM/selenodomain-associated transferase 1
MPPMVIVMTKAPRTGRVKTRLCPPLSADEGAELAACFIRDTLRQAARIVPTLIVAYDPPDGLAELRTLAPAGVRWLAQEGDDLGRRQEHAVACAAEQGFGPILVIGTDSPTLPFGHLGAALSVLERNAADVVLGPTLDGGYCLLGVRQPLPGLLDRVAWSTADVCRQVRENAVALGLRVELLSRWYDVDVPEDLRRLWEELCRSQDAREQAAATYRWLQARSAVHPLPG